jgi:hypothetical protein
MRYDRTVAPTERPFGLVSQQYLLSRLWRRVRQLSLSVESGSVANAVEVDVLRCLDGCAAAQEASQYKNSSQLTPVQAFSAQGATGVIGKHQVIIGGLNLAWLR